MNDCWKSHRKQNAAPKTYPAAPETYPAADLICSGHASFDLGTYYDAS